MEIKKYKDSIEVCETDRQIIFGNRRITIKISKQTGKWESFQIDRSELINYRIAPQVPVDIKVDREWIIEKYGCTFAGWNVKEENERIVLSVNLAAKEFPFTTALYIDMIPQSLIISSPEVIEAYSKGKRYEYIISCVYILEPGSAELRRRVDVLHNRELNFSGDRIRKLESFMFKLPGVIIENEEDCVIAMPGPIIPRMVLKPRMSYKDAKIMYKCRRPAPDFDSGLAAVANDRKGLVAGLWHETLQTAYFNHMIGDGNTVSMAINEECGKLIVDSYTLEGQPVIYSSHENVISMINGDIEDCLKAYSSYIKKVSPPRQDVPSWIRDAVIMEVDPEYFGGFKGIRGKLRQLADTGFNTIYLMPVCKGSYATADHYLFREELGTVEEFKEMVAEAHKLGIRVLLDLITSVMRRDHPLFSSHPEYFERDEFGRILPHLRWANASPDYAVSGYREYIVKFAEYAVSEYGIDGFRMDSPTAKSPNWYPHSGHEPWESIEGAYVLLGEVNDAIKKVNPEAVLLNEHISPFFFKVCDICHHLSYAYQIILEEVKKTGYCTKDYKNCLGDMYAIKPGKAPYVYYMRNHDTAWFYGFKGYNPEFFAYEAIHCIIDGIPLMFSGQMSRDDMKLDEEGRYPWDGPSEASFKLYSKLFQLRTENRILIEGECHYSAIDTDSDHIFSIIRTMGDQMAIGLVNTSGSRIAANVAIDQSKVRIPLHKAVLRDIFGDGGTISIEHSDNFNISLEPYAIHVFILE